MAESANATAALDAKARSIDSLGKGKPMRVEDVMTTRLVTVGFDDTLATVKEIFDAVKFRHLLVVEEGKLYGVVSDRDLLRATSPFIGSSVETARDIGTLKKRVHQIMTRKPVTLPPRADITEAVRLFLDNKVSCIPIVNEEFRPVGILSWRDILKTLAPEVAVPPSVADERHPENTRAT